jgi:molybdopterin/thiamine biosynthesis adenylyltransferase
MLAQRTRPLSHESVPSHPGTKHLGPEGQQRLLNSIVGVVGAGGVKNPILFYLAAAGVGTIRIVDFDRVELSNLNRQILYTVEDIGVYKAEAAAARLTALNPEIKVEPIITKVKSSNFEELFGNCDVVFEGGDSVEGRQEFNRAAVKYRKTYIHASAQHNYAYVFSVIPLETACFECVFDDLPRSHGGPVPVIGCATGISGAIGASEAINILIGRGPQIVNRILFFTAGSINLSTFQHSARRTAGLAQHNMLGKVLEEK